MNEMALLIGNKAYSSWSLRAWLMLRACGVPFREILVPLDQPDTRSRILEHSPSGLVPALIDGPLVVWDSLAIGEYLAERFPEADLWPADATARARARSVSAEMHAGFASLRRDMSMDLKRSRAGEGHTRAALADVARIGAIWADCRAAAPKTGPFLFGRFTIADAMYAPVVARLRTYGVPVDGAADAYCDAISAWPAMAEWAAAAVAEPWVLENH